MAFLNIYLILCQINEETNLKFYLSCYVSEDTLSSRKKLFHESHRLNIWKLLFWGGETDIIFTLSPEYKNPAHYIEIKHEIFESIIWKIFY